MSDDINDRGLSRKHILDSIDKSLQRLQMDYVDLYQIHRWDYETPIEETMEALNDSCALAKRAISAPRPCSRGSLPKSLHVSEKHGWTKFVSMQNHYNLVYREEEREMIPLCMDQGIGLIPWSPMARGFFAGNRKRGGGGETVTRQQRSIWKQPVFPRRRFHCRRLCGRGRQRNAVLPARRSPWHGS